MMDWLIASFFGMALLAFLLAYFALKSKNATTWFVAYARAKFSASPESNGEPIDIMLAIMDHYEPKWSSTDPQQHIDRVAQWHAEYPKTFDGYRDADGQPPKHSFFYPEEEYEPHLLHPVAELCQQGFGEIEVHLHHDDDTAENFRSSLAGFVGKLRREHGAFGTDPISGLPAWSFIHGNWSLCNSRADGRYCGVNDELTILEELGCYCDFTMPSAPSDTQIGKINSIYYAQSSAEKPCGHATGVDVTVGIVPSPESKGMMLLQGPLGFNWAKRRLGIMPAIENGDLSAYLPPAPTRTDLWVDLSARVTGQPNWRFVKLHTHGCQEDNAKLFFGGDIAAMHQDLLARYNDGERYRLHYVSAREMYNIVKAAEAGHTGNPNAYRDFSIPPPSFQANSDE